MQSHENNMADKSIHLSVLLRCSTDDPTAVLNGNRNSLMTAMRNLTMKNSTKKASTEGKIAVVRKNTFPNAPRFMPEG